MVVFGSTSAINPALFNGLVECILIRQTTSLLPSANFPGSRLAVVTRSASARLTNARSCPPLSINFPFRASRAPELALKTALAMELRAKVAFCTTAVKSLVGSAKAFSISVTATLTLVIAESVFVRPTALARYSPISDESLLNFLRFSSCCLAETSDVTMAPAVTPTILVVVEVD